MSVLRGSNPRPRRVPAAIHKRALPSLKTSSKIPINNSTERYRENFGGGAILLLSLLKAHPKAPLPPGFKGLLCGNSGCEGYRPSAFRDNR
jgi:hypothetical protein